MFTDKKFDVEHALNMYASSHVTMPAFGIYDQEVVERFRPNLQTCHIYVIGTLPKVEFAGARQEGRELVTSYELAGDRRELRWPLDADHRLIEEGHGWFVENEAGERGFPGDALAITRSPTSTAATTSRCSTSAKLTAGTDQGTRCTASSSTRRCSASR